MVKKIIGYSLQALGHLLTIFVIACLGMILVQGIKGEEKNLFGYTFYVIMTDSMTGELEVGDAIISNKNAEYEVGSVVTYVAKDGLLKGQRITHKVIAIYDDNGQKMVQTQGVKQGATPDTPIKDEEVLGVMVKRIDSNNLLLKAIRNPYSSFLLIVVPISLIAGFEIFSFSSNKKSNSEEENN